MTPGKALSQLSMRKFQKMDIVMARVRPFQMARERSIQTARSSSRSNIFNMAKKVSPSPDLLSGEARQPRGAFPASAQTLPGRFAAL